MRDNLPNMLRAAANEWWEKNKVVATGATRYDAALEEAADAIEELSKRVDESIPKDDAEIIISEVAKPRWIPVTERLPDAEGERVLVASNFLTSYLRVSICYFSKNLKDVNKYKFNGEKRSGFYAHDPDYGYYERQCVRYWMPLPEPPKEKS